MAAALLLRSQDRSIPANPGIPASRPSARAGYYAVGDNLVTDAGTSLGSLWHYGGGPDAWSQRGSIPASPGVPSSCPFAGEGHYAFGDNPFIVAGSHWDHCGDALESAFVLHDVFMYNSILW